MAAKNRILLGNPQVKYLLAENQTTINLIALCRAVALLRGRRLNCELNELPNNTFVKDCLMVSHGMDHYNFTVLFTNYDASKTCSI